MLELLVSIVAAVSTGIATGYARNAILARGMMDYPNSRSSHVAPVARGGGIAIVLVASITTLVLAFLGVVAIRLSLALLGGGVAIATIGFFDDRSSVSARVRLIVHVASACWAVGLLGGIGDIGEGVQHLALAIVCDIASVLGIVWVLNLFNFMDGIDGIAASEASFVTASGAVLLIISGSSQSVPVASLTIFGAALGFLVWNWPPAKIFMGDVGSGFLGFVIAVLALAAAHENAVMMFVWLILGGVFFIDATVTLFRRVLRHERVYEAHRTHAYQWMSRRWNSHKLVTLSVWGINLVWLLPLAWLCQRYPHYAIAITLLGLAPLVVLALFAGAGRLDSKG